eukprot:scaffold112844_cov27-Tisochrysis_lutea.AAC.2
MRRWPAHGISSRPWRTRTTRATLLTHLDSRPRVLLPGLPPQQVSPLRGYVLKNLAVQTRVRRPTNAICIGGGGVQGETQPTPS